MSVREKNKDAYKEYVKFYSRPRKGVLGMKDRQGRIMTTDRMFAEYANVSPATLSQWKKLPSFQRDVRLARASLVDGSYPDLLQAMIKKATEGDVPAFREIKEFLKEYEPDLSKIRDQEQADPLTSPAVIEVVAETITSKLQELPEITASYGKIETIVLSVLTEMFIEVDAS